MVDATNVQPEARKPLVALARQYHCIPTAIVLHLPEELCQERNRNRAYHIIYSMLVAHENLLHAFDLMKRGEVRTATPYTVPRDERIGVGFWGAGRGWLTHHLVMDRGALVNYQIITPSTFNASPRDPFGQGGPYEEAAVSTPILEEYARPEDFTGIDIFRAIRSFDPCMPCTTHIHTDAGVITRDVNTCACGVDEAG